MLPMGRLANSDIGELIMLLKNGKELLIRKAEKKDSQKILDYLNVVEGESDNLLFGANGFTMTVEQEEQYIKQVNNSQTSALFVGLIDSKIVCTGSVSTPTRERISHQCDVSIAVLKEFWGIGIGTCMMNEIINFVKHSGKLEIVHLGVRADNKRAIALYKKMGFQEIGLYPKFFKINGAYYDEILMNLYI